MQVFERTAAAVVAPTGTFGAAEEVSVPGKAPIGAFVSASGRVALVEVSGSLVYSEVSEL